MNRVYIKTYGCQMNERDSEDVAYKLQDRGYTVTRTESEADIVLLNTCSVREAAEQKAIGKAGHLLSRKRRGSSVSVGIIGCMAQNRGSALLDQLPDLDLIVGTQKFHRVPEHLDRIIAGLQAQGPSSSSIVDIEEEEGAHNTIKNHLSSNRKVSAYVSIMQGCNMNCAYCIVPTTRGQERSRSIEDIFDEVCQLVESGAREVTLLGQIVNSYGRRIIPFKKGKSPFVQLLEKLHDIRDLKRIRFTSPHPKGFKSDLVEAFGYLPKLGKYVHLPLQSGSNEILRKMNRPYTRESFLGIVDDLRRMIPDMYFSTDIIVGFPGEKEEDFQKTVDLFSEVKFDMGYIFKYSLRPGSPGEGLGDPVSQNVKDVRNQKLLSLLQEYSLSRNKSLVGTTEQVLVESPAKKGDGVFCGRTKGFRKVFFKGRERLIGELVDVRITDASVSSLTGELLIQD